jgi:hypothetical protein
MRQLASFRGPRPAWQCWFYKFFVTLPVKESRFPQLNIGPSVFAGG